MRHHAVIEPAVREALREALGAPSFLDAQDLAARALCATLLDALETGTARAAVAAAVTAARAESPSRPDDGAAVHATVSLLLAARELVRAALSDAACPSVADGLVRLSDELALAACEHDDARGCDKGPGLPAELHARVVTAARGALTRAPAELSGRHLPALAGCVDAHAHSLALLAAGRYEIEPLVRAAVLRGARTMTQRQLPAWTDAPWPTRVALARLGVLETAVALALAARDGFDPATPSQRAQCRALSRTALELAVLGARVGPWLAPAARRTGSAPQDTETARVVSDASPTAETSTTTETSMTTHASGTQALLKTIEIDAADAAWRTAGSQFVKLAREPLVALLSRHLAPDDEASVRARVASFLDTPIGAALLAGLLSVGLSAMPAAAGAVPARLGRELRVRAMADAGDLLADLLMGPLRQVAALYLQDASGITTATPASLGTGALAGAGTAGTVTAMPEREVRVA